MADGFFSSLDFALVMRRAYKPEWHPSKPSLDEQLCSLRVGGQAEREQEADDGDAGPLPVCTSEDELEFAAMGAPTEEQPHMFRGFSLSRGPSLSRETAAWRALGAVPAPAPGRKRGSSRRLAFKSASWLVREQEA